ncbi:MAG: DUF2461 domain-containing protein [Candidatus Nanopelagicales bacterium]|nr:DUF2461 domain-containing protein [Candidatus Nanopelagicales bacterium]
MSAFDGFPPETTEFLVGLSENNSKQWFDTHRADYDQYWVQAGKDFVIAAGERLQGIRPAVSVEPRVNGSLFRINRDIRFSKDKTPYKDHLDVWFWEGARKTAVSSFFFRLTPTAVLAGAGSHGIDRALLADYRRAVVDPVQGSRIAETVAAIESADLEVSGETLKRTPAGVGDVTEAQARLLRHTALSAFAEREVGKWVHSPEVLDWAEEQWKQVAPLHAWLVENVRQPAAA